MTLTELVPSLDLCQQLKAAGFPQDTAFKWCRLTGTEEYSINTDAENYYVPAEEVCAAPTAGELEEWLMRHQVNKQFRLWLGTNSYHVDGRAGDTLVAALAALVLEVAG